MNRQNSKPKPFWFLFRNQKDYCHYTLNGVKREKRISENATCKYPGTLFRSRKSPVAYVCIVEQCWVKQNEVDVVSRSQAVEK